MNRILKNVSTLQLEKPDHESSHYQKPEERFQRGNYEAMNREDFKLQKERDRMLLEKMRLNVYNREKSLRESRDKEAEEHEKWYQDK